MSLTFRIARLSTWERGTVENVRTAVDMLELSRGTEEEMRRLGCSYARRKRTLGSFLR